MESDLLRLLLHHRSDFLPRSILLDRLKISDSTLNTLLQTLSAWNYSFETHPTLGLRLIELPPSLHLDELRALLASHFTAPLFHLHETQSTMDFIKREGIQGAPHGTLVVANHQTAGRGRLGRTWSSRPELGLTLSLLVRPDFPIESYSRLTIIAAVATLESSERLSGLDLQIKWPNDLMIGKRKLAGILTEAHLDRHGKPFAIIGLGLNLLQTPEDFPLELQSKASSLFVGSGRKIRRTDFLIDWIQTFQKIAALPFSETSALWKSKCLNLGERILVTTPQGKIHGTAIDLEPNGTLLLRDDNGTIRSILSGIVELE